MFSLSISEQPIPDTTRENFRSVDGRFYAFINVEKKFGAWLSAFLRPGLTKEKLLAVTPPEVTYAKTRFLEGIMNFWQQNSFP